MKHLITSFVLFFSIFSSFAMCANDTPTHQPVIIEKQPTQPSSNTKPLSLNDRDIEAFLSGDTIFFIFNRNLGDADIVVSNLTTGEQWYGSLSGIGTTSVVLSGDSGDYDVAIYTDNGDYYGYFTL